MFFFDSLNFHFFFSGYFAYTGGTPYVAKLETPWISAGESVRLCLTFRYMMRAQASSSLNVSLKSIHDESEVLLYNLIGYHGDTWSVGQVSWMEKEDSKVTNKLNKEIFSLVAAKDCIQSTAREKANYDKRSQARILKRNPYIRVVQLL